MTTTSALSAKAAHRLQRGGRPGPLPTIIDLPLALPTGPGIIYGGRVMELAQANTLPAKIEAAA